MKQDSASEANWELISPLLDEAIGRLRRSDREAVLLRFYQRKSLAEVGRVMRVSEEAARKRVDRAVEKLRGMLEKQGVTATSAGLSAVLVGNVVQEVPARVLEGVMSAVGGSGSVVAGGIAKGAAKMMALGKVKVAAVVVVVIAAAVGVPEKDRQAIFLRRSRRERSLQQHAHLSARALLPHYEIAPMRLRQEKWREERLAMT